MIKLKFSGIPKSSNKLKLFKTELMNEVILGINSIAKELLEDSLKICPKDTGELRESGKVYKLAKTNNYNAQVGYRTPYAAIVHEFPTDTHWTTVGTEGKFLEKPAKENELKYLNLFKSKIKGSLG